MSLHSIHPTFGDTEWFRQDRFGMFIHFGLYALPARHEWIKSYERISEDKYQKYFDHFNPDLYDPREWARQAKAAGMKYAVLTTKHHEGFCLFDSQYTDYKVTNTPYGKDLVREFVDAFRAEGIRIGFYYSLIDWHHPHFPIDRIHPRRDDPDAAEQDKGRDMTIYAQYMRDQVRELLTNYGKIDILWFDFSYDGNSVSNPSYRAPDWMQFGGGKLKDQWEAEKLIALARELSPGIIINNRAGIEQDIFTPEQNQLPEWPRHIESGKLVTWETCQTFSGSWGYHRDETSWKSPEMLIGILIKTVSMGGNLIMNVGPTARGVFDYRAEAALKSYADWMRYNSRSIYGCTMAEEQFKAPNGCRLTQSEDGKRLYLHLLDYSFSNVDVANLSDRIEHAQFLHDGSEILYKCDPKYRADAWASRATVFENTVSFKLPVIKPSVLVPVIEILLKDQQEA